MKILGAAKKLTFIEFGGANYYFGSTLYPLRQNSLRLHTPLGRLRLLPHKSSKVRPLEKTLAFPKLFLGKANVFSKRLTLHFLPKVSSNGSTGYRAVNYSADGSRSKF